MLEIRGLQVHRAGFPVLKDVDLSLPDGSMLAVLGRNGAGKTTLADAIAGLVAPSGGTIEFAGSSITGLAPHAIARRGVALVPEGRNLFASMSVLENLSLGAHRHPWRWNGPPASALDRVWDLFPALVELRKQRVGTLSGGQRQMVALGRALASEPQLLILDEPSFGLSPQMVEATCEQLSTLQKAGASMLLIEQNVDVVREVATEAALLADGTIAATGRLDDLIASDVLRRSLFAGSAD